MINWEGLNIGDTFETTVTNEDTHEITTVVNIVTDIRGENGGRIIISSSV